MCSCSGDEKATDRQILFNETDTISGDLTASLFVGIVDLTIAETECSRPSLPFRCLSRCFLLDAQLRRSLFHCFGLVMRVSKTLYIVRNDQSFGKL